jgi:hypothetical protein
MGRMRVAVGLVLVVAASALAAQSAAALPEVGRCVARAGTGKYKDAACVEKAGSKTAEKQFEFLKGGEHLGFSAAAVGEAVLEAGGGTKIDCSSSTQTGKYDVDNGAIKEVEGVVLRFKECSLPDFFKCNSKGAAEGEIVTNALKGPLGYISGEKTMTPVVGQELTPETAKGAVAAFECTASAKVLLKGKEGIVEGRRGGNCVIAPLSPANVMTVTYTESFSGKEGAQAPQHFQPLSGKYCNLVSNVNGGAFEASTWTLTQSLSNEEALELKA